MASRTSLNLTQQHLDDLRGLAESLRLFQSRGPSAGRAGSISAVIARVAESYRQHPEATRLALAALFADLATADGQSRASVADDPDADD